VFKLLSELITLNLKDDISSNVHFDENTINIMSLESDTYLSDKEIFNKKKGITKKTIYAAKIRELSINMISGMVKVNLNALYPH